MPASLGAPTMSTMRVAAWTYELPPTGGASEGLEDYEIRTAEGVHVGVGLGVVASTSSTFLLADAGVMPPLVHRRIAIPWERVADVDHDALVVSLSVDRDALDEVALGLDPKRAMHGPGAEARRVDLPAALIRPAPPGSEGPVDSGLTVTLGLLAAAAPFSLFVLITIWITRGLSGWEYALLAIPFVLAAVTVALQGYRLFRAPHRGHHSRAVPATESGPARPSRAHRRLGGRSELVIFAVGGGVLYLTTQLLVVLALGERLPPLGWIGFAVASIVVLAASTILAVFLVRSSCAAGSEAPRESPAGTPGMHRVLLVADEGCAGEALCRPLAERLVSGHTEVLVVAPALVSGFHYLDSDVDAARKAARSRLDETVDALRLGGIAARGVVGSESPLEAIADALAVFAADEIVVATSPPERANWLEERTVERARELYEQPVVHLVVEPPPRLGPALARSG
jgi:hypothetical protein